MRGGAAPALLVACVCACAALASASAAACSELQRTYDIKIVRSRELVVSVYGRARRLAVWADGGAPPAAAAALLAAAAAAALGARPRRRAARDLAGLARAAEQRCEDMEFDDAYYDEITLAPSMRWDGGVVAPLLGCSRRPALPPRLAAGPGAAPAALRLLAALRARHSAEPACRGALHWQFYVDRDNLRRCGFTSRSDRSEPTADLWYSTDVPQWENVVRLLNESIIAAALQHNIHFMRVDSDADLRRRISDSLRGNNSSILFLDYDLWADHPGVSPVVPPICVPGILDEIPDCEPELDSTRSLRAVDFDVLSQKAPLLLNLFYRFAPTAGQLREVLEIAAARTDANVTEAACAWATANTPVFDSWLREETTERYWIAIFLCDADGESTRKIYEETATAVRKYTGAADEANVEIQFLNVDCSSGDELNDKFLELTSGRRWPTLVGALAAGAGAAAAASSARLEETALLAYRPPLAAPAAAVSTAGRLADLALATAFFISSYGWKRVAVISEPTKFAADYVTELRRDDRLIVRNVELTDDPRSFLSTANAQIFFLNVNASAAAALLCAARDLRKLSGSFVWIIRDWPSEDFDCADSPPANLFTVSYRWRGEVLTGDVPESYDDEKFATLRTTLYDLWNGTWPDGVVPMADALLSLIRCFKTFRNKHIERLYDLHGAGTTRLLLENLEEQNQEGILYKLNLTGGAPAAPYVFVHKCDGLHCESIAQWRIISGNVTVVRQQRHIFDVSFPGDGSRKCLTYSHGDEFDPNCQDVTLFSAIFCIMALFIFLYIWRRMRLRLLARSEDILIAQLLAQDTFPETRPIQLYDDSALEVYHELGSGCYGVVRHGVLRAPGGRGLAVAVKALGAGAARDDELLREAASLAALDHDNIVRLVGVCRSAGRLLILMEHAFFGDLGRYLRERRHLAECAEGELRDEDDERAHVSAEALTRLGAEAAAALEYLAVRGVVHRDVRAANCLVDGRRRLRLADFGLARRVGGAQYASRRRGLFPVLWMAPESLRRGVFSAAADAWALGVLLLELASLGARPYGAWPPARVLRHVRTGGRPPLPRDLPPAARMLLERCWAPEPDRRASAGEVRRALAAAPALLRPALAAPDPAPNDDHDASDDNGGFTYYFE